MEKRILIDASHKKQTRVAITNDNRVDGYEFEDSDKKQLKGNIYLGRISRVEPSLQAAFVNFGRDRHGFLAFNDIQSDYYQIPSEDMEKIKEAEEEIRENLKNFLSKIELSTMHGASERNHNLKAAKTSIEFSNMAITK